MKVLDRWRVGNAASDAKTIIMGLQNFKNISLANNLAETLSYEANVDFEVFCKELKIKLGNSKRENYKLFQRETRKSSETCFEFFAKLCSRLRSALGVDALNQ